MKIIGGAIDAITIVITLSSRTVPLSSLNRVFYVTLMRLGLLNCVYNTINNSIQTHNLTLKIVNLLVLANSTKYLIQKPCNISVLAPLHKWDVRTCAVASMVLSGEFQPQG